jgi:hypothetical protein
VILHARTADGQLGEATSAWPRHARRLALSPFADCMLYASTCNGKEERRARPWRVQVLRHHQRLHRLLGVFTKPNKAHLSRPISSTRQVRFGLSQVQIQEGLLFVALHCPRGHNTEDLFSFTLFFQVFVGTGQQLLLLGGPDFFLRNRWAGLWSCRSRITHIRTYLY